MPPAVAVVLATGASYWMYGYATGIHNHALQIPLVHWLQDPTLYPGDDLVATFDGYVTYFWVAIAWLTRWLPLEETLLALHALTLVAANAAVFFLARTVFPRVVLAPYLALWLLLWWNHSPGEEPVHWFYLTHTAAGTAMALWALVFAARGRWFPAWATAGILFNVHAVQSLYLALMLLAAQGAELASPTGRRPTAWLGPAVGAAIAAPTLAWVATLQPTPATFDLASFLRLFFPYHFFPTSLKTSDWAALVFLVGLVVTVVIGRERAVPVLRLARMAGALAGLWIVGGALAEILPHPLVLKLHVFRSSSFFTIIALVLFSGWVLGRCERRPTPEGRAAARIAVAAAAPVLFATNLFEIGSYLALLAGIVLLAVPWRSGSRWVAVVLAGVLFAAMSVDVARWRHDRESGSLRRSLPWVEVQRWAERNTAREATFLTPPHEEGFRVFSRRPVAGEWKDGAAVLWDPGFADDWLAWYRSVGGTVADRYDDPIFVRLRESWNARTRGEIEDLARALGAEFVVLRKDGHGNVSSGALFENESYFVIPVPGAADRPPPE